MIDARTLDAFHRIGAPEGEDYGLPPAAKLSRLLRPTFIAPKGKTLVWGDWSAIEARVLPWLAASRGADRVLDIIRDSDADPAKPDIYELTAAELLGKAPEDVSKDERQSHGKVPVLSLGYGGGLGALQAMATNYGVYLSDEVGLAVVRGWRENNEWARTFWGAHRQGESYGLWGAILSAMEAPDTIFPVGRVAYVFDRSYLGGTVFCALPCGRLLTYPSIRWERRMVEDKKTGEKVERVQLTFLKGYTRSALWYGKLAENVTQATAASILRAALRRLRRLKDVMPVVMHTHDEIVTETDEELWRQAGKVLLGVMEETLDWSEGLPLAASISTGWAYSKTVRELSRAELETGD